MYDIHQDFLKYEKMNPPLNPFLLPLVNKFIRRMTKRIPVLVGVSEVQEVVKGYQGAPIDVSVITPKTNDDSMLPALVYFHGGAFAMQAANHHKWLAYEYAQKTPCKVFFVDYRLLPKATFPIGLEDCYSAYLWVCENHKSLGVDGNRIAVGGDSAGGALAAGVCLLARDRNKPMPFFQMLVYPVTDERQASNSMKEFTNTPLWNSQLNAKMWKMYLKKGVPGKKEYASPAEATTLENMPPSYIEVAEFDCLRDEGIVYAEMLRDNGVQVTLHQTKRTIHGFEIAQENDIVLESVSVRIENLKNAFNKSGL